MELKEGIILKTNKYQENSKIAYIITKDGLITALIRASLEYKSKNFAYSQELTKILFDINKSKKQTFDTLTTGIVSDSYLNIKKDYETMFEVTKIMSLTYKAIEHVNNYDNLYNLFNFTLEKINNNSFYQYYLLIFKLKLLYLLGIGPNFHSCCECGNKNIVAFSIEKGGMVCEKCSDYKSFSSKYIEIMKILYLVKIENITDKLISDIKETENNNECYQLINNICNLYYEHYLSIKI